MVWDLVDNINEHMIVIMNEKDLMSSEEAARLVAISSMAESAAKILADLLPAAPPPEDGK
jgi:hypothetical protein